MVTTPVDRARRALVQAIANAQATTGGRVYGRSTVIQGQRMTCLALEKANFRGLTARELRIARRGDPLLICQPGSMDRATLLRRTAQELVDLGFGG